MSCRGRQSFGTKKAHYAGLKVLFKAQILSLAVDPLRRKIGRNLERGKRGEIHI